MSPHRPRKRFGQHFLEDPGVVDAILRAIAPTSHDHIVEIGPGPGVLTAPLLRTGARLDVVELDRDLASALRTRFAGDPNIAVHEADALGFDYPALGPALRVVGNLPYNISTPLLFHLLEQRSAIIDLHFMLQKEVVDRMVASPGSKQYGRLGIMLGCYFDIEALFDVDRSAFRPPPKVTSSVVRLRPLAAGAVRIDDPLLLSRLVATAFGKRRKTLRNALRDFECGEQLESLGIDAGVRPENVAIADWVSLANALGSGSGPLR